MQVPGRARREGAGGVPGARGSAPASEKHKQSPTAVLAPLQLPVRFSNTIYVTRGLQKEGTGFGYLQLDMPDRGLFEDGQAPAMVDSVFCVTERVSTAPCGEGQPYLAAVGMAVTSYV